MLGRVQDINRLFTNRSMWIGKVLNRVLKNFFESHCYLIQSCNNMIMLFIYSTMVVILMLTVSKTVVDSFRIKYWLTSANKKDNFFLKLRKNSGVCSNTASTVFNTLCRSQRNFSSLSSFIDQQPDLI